FLVPRSDTSARGPPLYSRRHLARRARMGAAKYRSSRGIDGKALGVAPCFDRRCPYVSRAASRRHSVEPPARDSVRLWNQYMDDLQPGTLAARNWRTSDCAGIAAGSRACLTHAHGATRCSLCFHGGESAAGRAHCRCDRTVHYLEDRKSTRLNSSHRTSSYAVFCLKKQNRTPRIT